MPIVRMQFVVGLCEELLRRARDTDRSSSRTYYVHGFFAKAVQHGRSILALIEADKSVERQIDVGATCVLTRCILEIFNAAAYLTEAGVGADESDLRFNLFLLNHSTDLGRINRGLGINHGRFRYEASRQLLVDQLKTNPSFTSLDEDHKKRLLKGRSPYLTARYKGRRPLPAGVESALYTLFSQNAHSFSLGLAPVIGGGRATPIGEENAFFIALDTAALYLANLALLYWRIRYRAIKQLSIEERDKLRTAASPVALLNRISGIRKNYPLKE